MMNGTSAAVVSGGCVPPGPGFRVRAIAWHEAGGYRRPLDHAASGVRGIGGGDVTEVENAVESAIVQDFIGWAGRVRARPDFQAVVAAKRFYTSANPALFPVMLTTDDSPKFAMPPQSALDAITSGDLLAHITALSADEFGGARRDRAVSSFPWIILPISFGNSDLNRVIRTAAMCRRFLSLGSSAGRPCV